MKKLVKAREKGIVVGGRREEDKAMNGLNEDGSWLSEARLLVERRARKQASN